MRAHALILTGFLVLGCKDKEAPRASTPASAPASGSGGSGAPSPSPSASPSALPPPPPSPTPLPPSAGSAATNAPAVPRLEAAEAFDRETEDKDWATNTERAMQSAAPELADIECKQSQCRGTVSAATQEELVKLVQKLDGEDGLRSINAKNMLLTPPETIDGKTSMKIYVRFDR